MTEQSEYIFAKLVKDVMTSPSGAEFLEALRSRYLDQPMFSTDVAIMAYRTGRADMIREIQFYLKATPEDLEAPVSPESHPFD